MSDIDLIPADYRDWRNRKRTLLQFAIGTVLVNALVVVAGLTLGYLANEQNQQAESLKAENAVTEQQQAQLEDLEAQQSELTRRWSMLRGLRAGAAIDDIFSVIDRTIIPDELWFVSWSFRRAGVIVDGEQRGIETGYFIVVAQDGATDRQDFSVETHMTIRGQARDHQALSKFVRALFEEPDIKDVDLRKSSLTNFANGRVVDFDMTIVLNNAVQET